MIAFSHVTNKSTRGTIAIDLPAKQDLSSLFEQHGTATIMAIGTAQLHPEDHFNRPVGREVSQKRLVYTAAYIKSVEIRGIKHIYHFRSEVPDTSSLIKKKKVVIFGISTTKEEDVTKLMYATFGE
jgi:hypothetical protein